MGVVYHMYVLKTLDDFFMSWVSSRPLMGLVYHMCVLKALAV